MKWTRTDAAPERLLTVAEVAEVLGTSQRFPRRLIEERRIRFVRVGRYVRIPESALREFIAAGRVEPITRKGRAALWVNAVSGGYALSRLAATRPDIRGRTATTTRRRRPSRPRRTRKSG
jgi:excisionase family DNA binding protein